MINNLISMLINIYKNLDKKALIVLKHGLSFCSILCTISVLMLFIYNFMILNPLMFNIGLMLFRISLIFAIEFIICAIAVDKIKKQLI